MSLIGKPLVLDRLDAELGARVVQLIVEDNERALKRRRERAQQKAQKKAAREARREAAKNPG